MSHWINPEIDLGIIKANSPKKIMFQASETIPKIKSIVPYCGCTTVNYNFKNRQLFITYSNSSIPPQVVGSQEVIKKISVIYEDDTEDLLLIKATKIR
jgi:hypothetical protein